MHSLTEGSFKNSMLEDNEPNMPMEEKLERKAAEKEASHIKATRRSNRAILMLVITMCLISLVVLLLTLLIVFGKIGNGCGCSADEASSSSTQSLATDFAKIKALEESITSLQQGLMEHLVQFNNTLIKAEAEYNALRGDLNMTQNELLLITDNITLTSRLKYLGVELTGLKSVLNRTITDLAELKITQTKEKVIYHQTMTPNWLKAHASYINSALSSTTEQLTFIESSWKAALLKVPLIPANVLQNSTMLTVKIVVYNNVSIEAKYDSDTRYGVSDGINFVGFETVNKGNYNSYAPCFGSEGYSGTTLTGERLISYSSAGLSDSFYPGQFVITLKLDALEIWGSCYTAHDGGFLKTAVYKKSLVLNRGLTLEAYKGNTNERVGIKFIEVTVVDDL